MRSPLLLILFIASVGILGCNRPLDQPPAKRDAAAEAIDYARKIVSDPSNWKSNTVLLTDLGAAAQDLGITDTPEFKEFDSSAQELIRFGTTWISSLDEGAVTRLRNQLSHITSKTDASLTARIPAGPESVPTGAGADATIESKKDSQRVEAEAERAVFTSIEGLRAAQAEEFGRLFARAQLAFRALRLRLQHSPQRPNQTMEPTADQRYAKISVFVNDISNSRGGSSYFR